MVAVDNKCLLLGGFTVLMFFMWMDIALWYNLQALSATDATNPARTSASTSFSVFYPITVKMLMTDPTNHYIFLPFCHAFVQITHFTEVLSWVTPNMISIARLAVILPGLRLIMSESLGLRQAGVAIIIFGEWMDALDGFVARAKMSTQALTSDVGKMGYYLDGICDGISCTMLMLAVLVLLRRHPPRAASHAPLQLPVSCCRVEGGGGSSAAESKDKESLLGGAGGGGAAAVGARVPAPPRLITLTLVLFGGQLLLASVGWNHAVTGYQAALQSPDGTHTARQLVVLKSAATWILMWFWRVFCFHSLIQCFIISIFFNRIWEFVTAVRYIGFVALIALIALNEIHLQTISLYF